MGYLKRAWWESNNPGFLQYAYRILSPARGSAVEKVRGQCYDRLEVWFLLQETFLLSWRLQLDPLGSTTSGTDLRPALCWHEWGRGEALSGSLQRQDLDLVAGERRPAMALRLGWPRCWESGSICMLLGRSTGRSLALRHHDSSERMLLFPVRVRCYSGAWNSMQKSTSDLVGYGNPLHPCWGTNSTETPKDIGLKNPTYFQKRFAAVKTLSAQYIEQ